MKNDSVCIGCHQWFTQEEYANKDTQLRFFGDLSDFYIYVHPRCVEILFEQGVLYYANEERDDAN
jgi:hypothetical protein